MQRGQATVEWLALAIALVVGLCLLVRYATPVEAVGRALAHALEGRARDGPHVRPSPRPRAPARRARRPPARRCYCRALAPAAGGTGGAVVTDVARDENDG